MKHYIISIWSGEGYTLSPFEIEADDEDQALERLSQKLIEEKLTELFQTAQEHKDLYEWLEIDEDEDESHIYVDGTSEGADYPIWINSENLTIEARQ